MKSFYDLKCFPHSDQQAADPVLHGRRNGKQDQKQKIIYHSGSGWHLELLDSDIFCEWSTYRLVAPSSQHDGAMALAPRIPLGITLHFHFYQRGKLDSRSSTWHFQIKYHLKFNKIQDRMDQQLSEYQVPVFIYYYFIICFNQQHLIFHITHPHAHVQRAPARTQPRQNSFHVNLRKLYKCFPSISSSVK